MLLVLGVLAAVVIVVAVGVTAALARRQSQDDTPPPSRGGDFVAPISSGGYRFRAPDESPEEFKARVEAENEEIASSQRPSELSQK
jgi:hypothetical protein